MGNHGPTMGLGSGFEDILEAARAGGDWAWAAIYRDLAPAVTGYLGARGAASPDDLTGDVFLHLVRSIDSFEGDEGSFRSWVFTVAHNRLIDSVRYEKRRPAEPVSDDRLQALGPRYPDPAEHVSVSLEVERARRLIARLTPDQQDVLLLRLFGDLTFEEVAATLGKRVVAVKALQRRGLAALQREISAQGVSR
ncbi:MAG: RNA polymerase sigma factor [Actinomycetota bacterium]